MCLETEISALAFSRPVFLNFSVLLNNIIFWRFHVTYLPAKYLSVDFRKENLIFTNFRVTLLFSLENVIERKYFINAPQTVDTEKLLT